MAELFIDGHWTAGGETRPVVNPFDGSVLTTVAEADAKDALAAVAAARAAFDQIGRAHV